MRANIDLDTDAYAFASSYADVKGLPLGAASSELLRRAEAAPESPSPLLITNHRGLRILAKGDRVVTPAMVKDLAEDDCNE